MQSLDWTGADIPIASTSSAIRPAIKRSQSAAAPTAKSHPVHAKLGSCDACRLRASLLVSSQLQTLVLTLYFAAGEMLAS